MRLQAGGALRLGLSGLIWDKAWACKSVRFGTSTSNTTPFFSNNFAIEGSSVASLRLDRDKHAGFDIRYHIKVLCMYLGK